MLFFSDIFNSPIFQWFQFHAFFLSWDVKGAVWSSRDTSDVWKDTGRPKRDAWVARKGLSSVTPSFCYFEVRFLLLRTFFSHEEIFYFCEKPPPQEMRPHYPRDPINQWTPLPVVPPQMQRDAIRVKEANIQQLNYAHYMLRMQQNIWHTDVHSLCVSCWTVQEQKILRDPNWIAILAGSVRSNILAIEISDDLLIGRPQTRFTA